MDPSIMKLLEEDEDESMHSGADVEAFQAQLNRDLGGDDVHAASSSQLSDSDTAVLSQGISHTMNQSFAQWPNPSQEQNTNQQIQQNPESAQQHDKRPTESELNQHISLSVNQQHQNQELSGRQIPQGHGQTIPQSTGLPVSDKAPIPNRMPNQENESQYAKLQKMSDQQASAGNDNPMTRGKQVPFAVLMPTIVPQLDKDRAMQLHELYAKLKKNEIPKEGFVRHMRNIVGDQMLRMAVSKLQAQMGSNQFPLQPRPSMQQRHPRMPSASTGPTPLPMPQPFAQLQQKASNSPVDTSHIRPSPLQMRTDSTMENDSAPKSQELDRQNSLGIQVTQMGVVKHENDQTLQGLNKQQQQPHLHFPQSSFPSYRNTGGNYQPYSGTNMNTLRPQVTHQQNMAVGPSQAMNMMNVPKFERQNLMNDPNRVQGSSLSQFTTNSALQQNSVSWQASANKEQNSSGPMSSMAYIKREPIDQGLQRSSTQVNQSNTPPGKFKEDTSERQPSRMGSAASTGIVQENSESPSIQTPVDPNVLSSVRTGSVSSLAGVNVRTPQKKSTSGQKKPLEAGSTPPSKKQKTGGAASDQSIDQLNDVTAVSGVDLREEEEQLFSVPKEDSRASEASRRIMQEEEERLLLQRTPLQKKLAEIMAKSGLKSVGNDVERCLSLCVEERLRGLLANLIRLSRQRVDAEKPRHRTVITSDVREQIMTMNLKAREEWEKKQAEAEKIRKLNEPESDSGPDGDKEKDDGRLKFSKVNRDEDEKMRASAANDAARAAVGGDDMLSKWQLMAEQARQKREGGNDSAASGSQPVKDTNDKSVSTAGRITKDNQEVVKRGNTIHAASESAFLFVRILRLYATYTDVLPYNFFTLGGTMRRFGRNQDSAPQTRVARSISVKDVIAALEREPQMSKSTLIYGLYEKIHSDTAPE
ncbi:hypothetical protein ACFE04_005921 [Oxalis oulophora]